MKQLIMLLELCLILIFSLKLDAQNCIDTVHVKGYYIVKRIASEIGPQITKKNNSTLYEYNIDSHYDPSFVPCDSISINYPLSYWLNHFFDETKQVFISCERFNARYFISKTCLQSLVNNKNNRDTCLFPSLISNVLYKTTNVNSQDVFEIYYLDAYWARIKVKTGSVEADWIPSRIAEIALSSGIKELNLYCFIRCDSLQMNLKIKDPHVHVWKNKQLQP